MLRTWRLRLLLLFVGCSGALPSSLELEEGQDSAWPDAGAVASDAGAGEPVDAGGPWDGGGWAADAGTEDGGECLAFRPPTLVNPTTVKVTNAKPSVTLDAELDYRVVIAEPIDNASGVTIVGGRNVVLIGGSIESTTRGLYLKFWTGTMHVEGLHIKGAKLTEGIDVDTRTEGAVLQLENVRVEAVHGTQATNHADVIQNWGGPTVYRIDRLTGFTNYQGFMLQPKQFGLETRELDWRHINVGHLGDAGYLIFRASGTTQMSLTDVWLDAQPASHLAYPVLDPDWSQLHVGPRPSGDAVPASAVGLSYVSPCYQP